jgi:hypothetical protein
VLIVATEEGSMEAFTVSLFGHRIVDDRKAEGWLASIIKELICSHCYVAFLVGRNGEFDELAARIIKMVSREVGCENNHIILVLPYAVKDIEFYESYYDSIVIPEDVERAHPKAKITLRNRWMIDHSDLVVAYIEHSDGGAYTAIKYAETKNKEIIRLS